MHFFCQLYAVEIGEPTRVVLFHKTKFQTYCTICNSHYESTHALIYVLLPYPHMWQ